MRIPEKQEALIVRGVVIPCGIPDNTGDAPQYKEDIKKIFTNYLTHETDVQHSWVKNFGVYVLENTLTEQTTSIAGQEVPQDSWIASMMVVNPEIQEMIRTSKLQGFSLGAVHDDALNENVNFLHKSLRYEQLKDSEDLNPLFISLVDRPACGFKWEVYDYNSFLAKSQNYDGVNSMTENNNFETNNDEMVSTSFVERLMDKFMMKSENNTEEETKNEELEKAEPEDITNAQLLEQLPNAVATAVVEALQKLSQQDNSSEEEKLEKDESENEDEKKDDNGKMEKEETTTSDSDSTSKEEEKLEKSNNHSHHDNRNFMEKSTSRIVDNTQKTERNTYLNSETRDMFGRNKKYL